MATGKGPEMSANLAPAKINGTETSTPTAAAVPTGYRVTVVPGALEKRRLIFLGAAWRVDQL